MTNSDHNQSSNIYDSNFTKEEEEEEEKAKHTSKTSTLSSLRKNSNSTTFSSSLSPSHSHHHQHQHQHQHQHHLHLSYIYLFQSYGTLINSIEGNILGQVGLLNPIHKQIIHRYNDLKKQSHTVWKIINGNIIIRKLNPKKKKKNFFIYK